jgi:Flp pilus assembly protein TadG
MRKWNCLSRLSASLARRRDRLARFWEAENGATAIEFAFVAVPFMGLLAAIFETAFVFFATQGLEAAVADASRTILTGQVQSNTAITTAQQFRNAMICNPTAPMQRTLPSFINCSDITVDVRPVTAFAGADTSNDIYQAATGEYCTGGPGDIIIVRAVYPMPVYFSILDTTSAGKIGTNTAGQTSYGGGFVSMIEGISAFRNEPFPGYTGPAQGC